MAVVSTAVNATGVQPSSATAEDIVRDGCVSVEEAAKHTGLSRPSLYRLMERGDLRYVRLCGRRLIPRTTLTALLAAHLTGCDR
jgi:excisionase family DNA binding protein